VLRTLRRTQEENAAYNDCSKKQDETIPGFHRISSLMIRQLALGESGLAISCPGTALVYALPAHFGTWHLHRWWVNLML
jgi:hypothetical protein